MSTKEPPPNMSEIETLLPDNVKAMADKLANIKLNPDLHDELITYLFIKLYQRNKSKSNPLGGLKLIADTKQHIEEIENSLPYRMVKNAIIYKESGKWN